VTPPLEQHAVEGEPLIDLDEDAALALKLLDAAGEKDMLMLPSGLDNAVRELECLGLAKINMVGGSIPLAHITPEGREQQRRRRERP
jgi:hypothetical protein